MTPASQITFIETLSQEWPLKGSNASLKSSAICLVENISNVFFNNCSMHIMITYQVKYFWIRKGGWNTVMWGCFSQVEQDGWSAGGWSADWKKEENNEGTVKDFKLGLKFTLPQENNLKSELQVNILYQSILMLTQSPNLNLSICGKTWNLAKLITDALYLMWTSLFIL